MLKGLGRYLSVLAAIAGLNSCSQESSIAAEQAKSSNMNSSIKQFARENLRDHDRTVCDQVTFCNAMFELRCHPEADGPVSYYDARSGDLLVTCSFFDRKSHCPPPEWEACMATSSSPH